MGVETRLILKYFGRQPQLEARMLAGGRVLSNNAAQRIEEYFGRAMGRGAERTDFVVSEEITAQLASKLDSRACQSASA